MLLERRSLLQAAGRATGALLLMASFLLVAVAPASAQAQAGTQAQEAVPSVGVQPTESRPEDPNGGQWFVFSLAPGESGRTTARIVNPAHVPQAVRLYFRDLVFGKDGTPAVAEGKQTDLGLWGRTDQSAVAVPPRGTMEVGFAVTVPAGAEPGDHVGALVVESEPQGGEIKDEIKVVKRVATRVYVTVPGEARRAVEITSVTSTRDSSWFAKRMSVEVVVRNTGRVRLHPTVTVGGRPAAGPDVLLARSSERYLAEVDVPWYGGPVGATVKVVADGGLVREARASAFVVPWGLLLSLVAAAGLMAVLVAVWRRRQSKIARLHSDIRRLEKLITGRPVPGAAGAVEAGGGDLGDLGDLGEDAGAQAGTQARIDAIETSLKRARRRSDDASFVRLALALHEAGAATVAVLQEAASRDDGSHGAELAAAIDAHGQTAPPYRHSASIS